MLGRLSWYPVEAAGVGTVDSDFAGSAVAHEAAWGRRLSLTIGFEASKEAS